MKKFNFPHIFYAIVCSCCLLASWNAYGREGSGSGVGWVDLGFLQWETLPGTHLLQYVTDGVMMYRCE